MFNFFKKSKAPPDAVLKDVHRDLYDLVDLLMHDFETDVRHLPNGRKAREGTYQEVFEEAIATLKSVEYRMMADNENSVETEKGMKNKQDIEVKEETTTSNIVDNKQSVDGKDKGNTGQERRYGPYRSKSSKGEDGNWYREPQTQIW